MSILIKGMDMPETGCYILSVDNTGKDKTIFTIAEHTHSGKIIPRYVGEAVPISPHGRLIDADIVISLAMEDILMWEDAGCDRDDYRAFLANYIEDAPTIISAEEDKR